MAPRRPRPADLAIGEAVELFCEAKTAEGLSPRSVRWYHDILTRAALRFGRRTPLDDIEPADWRAWLVELRKTLAPVSIAGYVRCLRVFANWLAAEGLADAVAIRHLAKPRVPRKLIEPLSDDELRELLALASRRDHAILLLLPEVRDAGARLAIGPRHR